MSWVESRLGKMTGFGPKRTLGIGPTTVCICARSSSCLPGTTSKHKY